MGMESGCRRMALVGQTTAEREMTCRHITEDQVCLRQWVDGSSASSYTAPSRCGGLQVVDNLVCILAKVIVPLRAGKEASRNYATPKTFLSNIDLEWTDAGPKSINRFTWSYGTSP